MAQGFPYYAQPSSPSGQQVAVIGAGYAGLAAGVVLAEAGAAVTVFEASRSLGGRARRVVVDGRTVDNGQHILSGAYRDLLGLMRSIGLSPDDALLRLPLHLRIVPGFSFEKAQARPPWDMALGLLKAKGLGPVAAFRMVRFLAAMQKRDFRLEGDEPLLALLERHRQPERARTFFWEPLCLAALNTPMASASAQVFLNVLRDGVMGGAGANDLLLPKVDLGRLFPDAASKYITDRGGIVRTASPVRHVYWAGDGWYLDGISSPFSAVIVATAPQHAVQLLEEVEDIEATRARLAGLDFLPISTIYLQYESAFRLPSPMIGLAHGPGQWVFDRGQLGGPAGLMAVVISAATATERTSNQELAKAVAEQLAALLGAPAKTTWRQVITERRATIACRPHIFRPGNLTESDGLLLAGDYTASPYPCTLESAVQSGIAAARHVLTPASARTPPPR